MADFDMTTLGGSATAVAAAIAGARYYFSDAKIEERRKRFEDKREKLDDVQQKSVINGVVANDTVLKNLVDEVERMKLRETDFEKRITELESRVTLLTNKLASVKLMAIDCYALATDCGCEAKAALLKHLKELIEAA